MLHVAVCARFDLLIVGAGEHISSEENHVCDDLSRGVPVARELMGREGQILLQPDGILNRTMALCDPLRNPSTDEEFLARFWDINQLLSSIERGDPL